MLTYKCFFKILLCLPLLPFMEVIMIIFIKGVQVHKKTVGLTILWPAITYTT